jgi:transposase
METKHYKRNLRDMGPVRRLGMQLLTQGAAQAEVVRELGVSRTTAWNWAAALAHGEPPTPDLPAPAMPDAQMERLDVLLRAGARSHGFPSDQWTMARLAVLIECEFGFVYSTLHVWRMLGATPFLRPRPSSLLAM